MKWLHSDQRINVIVPPEAFKKKVNKYHQIMNTSLFSVYSLILSADSWVTQIASYVSKYGKLDIFK